MKMRRDVFRTMVEALQSNATRRLAGYPEESDVALLLRKYQPMYEATGDALNKAQLDFVSKGDKSKIIDHLGMQVAIAKANEHLMAVPLPKRKLTKAHLPKEFDGPDGEKNCAGRAEIMADLGPLFEMDKSPERQIEFEDVSAEEAELAEAPKVLELHAGTTKAPDVPLADM